MIEPLVSLGSGLLAVLTPANLLYCLLGCLLGTLVGVLPGIGSVATIAILLPLTLSVAPLTALIMLAGIYYGAMYGGSTTAILVNLPGEATSVVTSIDGHQMARKGRAGAALMVAAVGSFFAGCFATIFIAYLAPKLAEFALLFNAPENFALVVLALIGALFLARGSILNATTMVVLGVILGIWGTDTQTGTLRYTFGWQQLSSGLDFVALVVGLFGLAEIVKNLSQSRDETRSIAPIGGLWLTRQEWKQAWPAIFRGTALGSFLGILPGGGVLLSPFASYMLEKKLARDPSRFGEGAIEGVAGPESANNAAAQTSFIPMLTLGIPANPVIALLLGAMMLHGIRPGPEVMTSHPQLFWGLIASMLVGNLMLLVLNLPLIGIWIRLLNVPYRFLFPAILVFCCIGTYSINSSGFDLVLVACFGAIGIILYMLDFPIVPMIVGFILGPMAEDSLRRALVLSRGDPFTFIERPVSAAIIAVGVLLALVLLLPAMRRVRKEAAED